MYNTFAWLLKEKGVKAIDVSRATGIHSAVFSEWKKGKSEPKIDKLIKIANYFNVPVLCFIDENINVETIPSPYNNYFEEVSEGRDKPIYEKGSADKSIREDYKLKQEAEKSNYYLNDETAKIAQEIFEHKELRALFSAARTATPEDLKITHDMLLALKRKERGTND